MKIRISTAFPSVDSFSLPRRGSAGFGIPVPPVFALQFPLVQPMPSRSDSFSSFGFGSPPPPPMKIRLRRSPRGPRRPCLAPRDGQLPVFPFYFARCCCCCCCCCYFGWGGDGGAISRRGKPPTTDNAARRLRAGGVVGGWVGGWQVNKGIE